MMELPSPEAPAEVDAMLGRVFAPQLSPPAVDLAALREHADRLREDRRIVALCSPDQLDELKEGLKHVPDGDLVTLVPAPHLRRGTVLVTPAAHAELVLQNDEKAPTPDEGRGGLT